MRVTQLSIGRRFNSRDSNARQINRNFVYVCKKCTVRRTYGVASPKQKLEKMRDTSHVAVIIISYINMGIASLEGSYECHNLISSKASRIFVFSLICQQY